MSILTHPDIQQAIFEISDNELLHANVLNFDSHIKLKFRLRYCENEVHMNI